MTIPLAWSLDWGPLAGSLFLAGALLVGAGLALRRWTRRWGGLCIALGALPLALAIAGQVAAIAGRPALRVSAADIACTPWARAVAWSDVSQVLGEDVKSARSWRTIGIVLVLRPGPLSEAGPPLVEPGLWGWAARLSRNRVAEIGAAPEPRPGGELYCQTLDLAPGAEDLKRLADELARANAGPAERRAGLAWCEASGHLDVPCIANAEAWHRACVDADDYDACRRGGL